MIKKITALFCLVFILFQVSISAQVTTASISGTVRDDNAVLPGAIIQALHVPSGTQYGTAALENGRFHLPNLRVGGPYKITITFLGHEPTEINDVYLSLGQEMEVNALMKAPGVNIQEVVVSGRQDPVFNTDHTGAVTNVSNQEIQMIPSINRSLSDMVRITPQSTGNNTFAGRNNLYNNLTINGSLFNNAFGLASLPGGQTNSQPISLDAIDQVQVSMAPYDVRQSDFTGAGINAVTRSGTNEYTGSVYTYWRNQQYIGTKIENTTVARSNFNQSQSGFRLGGPIIKNKLFFFLECRNGTKKRTCT
ncbi:MAG TPA: TonB-dependent receptor [Bacteroidales bacterium]